MIGVIGQYRGYRDTKGVAPDSSVETFVALTFAHRQQLKRPPQSLFGEDRPRDADYFRFRLSPDMSISLGAVAKKPGEAMAGEPVELLASHESGSERPPYQRLIGDACRGDQSLFAGEDLVEAAWRVVDGVLDDKTPVHVYEPGTWGPPEAAGVLDRGDRWHDPVGKLQVSATDAPHARLKEKR